MSGSDYESSGWIVRTTGNKYVHKNFENTFSKLQKEAEEESGYYSADINRASGFMQCGVMTRRQYNQGQKWVTEEVWGRRKLSVPKLLVDQGVVRKWKDAYLDKDGPACAVVIKDETRDTTIVSRTFIKDKGIIPAKNRESKKYVINYDERWGPSQKRVGSVPDAWKWIKSQLKQNPNFKIGAIENSFTYAKPKLGQTTKKGKLVRTMFFGFGDD